MVVLHFCFLTRRHKVAKVRREGRSLKRKRRSGKSPITYLDAPSLALQASIGGLWRICCISHRAIAVELFSLCLFSLCGSLRPLHLCVESDRGECVAPSVQLCNCATGPIWRHPKTTLTEFPDSATIAECVVVYTVK